MNQGNLPLSLASKRASDEDIGIETIAKRQNLTKAILFCLEASGIPDGVFSDELGIDSATFSKIKSGTRHFPVDKINTAMDFCGNEIPLRWLANSRGYGLVRLQSEVERENEELRRKNEDLELKMNHFQEFMGISKN